MGRKRPQAAIYTMDYIFDYKEDRQGNPMYHVKWYKYPVSQSTWEPESNILDPNEAIREQMQQAKQRWLDRRNLTRVARKSARRASIIEEEEEEEEDTSTNDTYESAQEDEEQHGTTTNSEQYGTTTTSEQYGTSEPLVISTSEPLATTTTTSSAGPLVITTSEPLATTTTTSEPLVIEETSEESSSLRPCLEHPVLALHEYCNEQAPPKKRRFSDDLPLVDWRETYDVLHMEGDRLSSGISFHCRIIETRVYTDGTEKHIQTTKLVPLAVLRQKYPAKVLDYLIDNGKIKWAA